jgi:NitT/TauT family transport system substrate-binding protein
MSKAKCSCHKLFLLFFSLLWLFGCKPAHPPRAPDPVRLQLKWFHQAQFAGFYLAQEKGHYARENLKVTFLEGGPEVDLSGRVMEGRADFAVLSPDDFLLRRSDGAPLKALAAIYRRSAVVFVARADSGIEKPADFLGRTVAARNEGGAREFYIQLLAMMHRLGLNADRVKLTSYDPAYTDFLAGRVDITPCYSTGGLIRLRKQGLKLNLIRPDDYGIHFYSDILITHERLISEKPDLVRRFLRASLKGWQEAIEDYPQGVQAALKYAKLKDPALQTAMMEALLPLVHTGEDRIGWMRPETWQGMAETLSRQGLIKRPFDVNQAYTLRFLKEIYGEQPR